MGIREKSSWDYRIEKTLWKTHIQCSSIILAQQVREDSCPVRQNVCTRGALSWGGGEGGSGVRDMAAPLLGNVGAEFSETLFPHFKTYFLQIDCCYL